MREIEALRRSPSIVTRYYYGQTPPQRLLLPLLFIATNNPTGFSNMYLKTGGDSQESFESRNVIEYSEPSNSQNYDQGRLKKIPMASREGRRTGS